MLEAQNQEFLEGNISLIKKKFGKNRYQCGACHSIASNRNEIKGKNLNSLRRHIAGVTHRRNQHQRQHAESKALQADGSEQLNAYSPTPDDHTCADEQQNDGINNTPDGVDVGDLESIMDASIHMEITVKQKAVEAVLAGTCSDKKVPEWLLDLIN